MRTQIDGILIVDKPEGITSFDVVREMKRRFLQRKAGHIGTLDPFATGVLPIVINEGTKLVPFLGEDPKQYEAVLKLGEETSTDDPTGEILLRKSWGEVKAERIHAVFASFVGKIQQIPPMFSAVKIRGKPLYHWARKGVQIERKERRVEILDIRVNEIALPKIHFNVSCSKGTYVRTLARDIGRQLACGAHLVSLRRIQSGPFNLKRAISWERLKSVALAEELGPWLISMKEALEGLPEVMGDEQMVRKIRFGKEMVVRDLALQPLPAFERGQWLKMSSPEEGLVAILRSEVKDAEVGQAGPDVIALRPLRVFHAQRRFHHKDQT